MFKNASYKQKNLLLLAGSLLFLMLAYRLSLSKTVGLFREINMLEEQLNQLDQAPQQLADLNATLSELERYFTSDNGEDGNREHQLLETVSSYCAGNGIVLREFPQPIRTESQDYVIETNILLVEGIYKKLLYLVYELEQKHTFGKIASLQFETKKELKTGQKKLMARVFIQNIKKKKNE